jgi:hypothetical protein
VSSKILNPPQANKNQISTPAIVAVIKQLKQKPPAKPGAKYF